MPISHYGVWKAYLGSFDAEREPASPHLYLDLHDNLEDRSVRYDAAINIKSGSEDSRLVYWYDEDFQGIQRERLDDLTMGFTELQSDNLLQLDYLRGGFLDLKKGKMASHDVPGKDNDIIDYLSPVLSEAVAKKAKIFVFGEPYADRNVVNHTGIHNAHMNQGNSEPFTNDNGVFQDGGIIIAFKDHLAAIFLAFASQKIKTKDTTGAPSGTIDLADHLGNGDPADVIVEAALFQPNPNTQTKQDVVHLHNQTARTIELAGWSITNDEGRRREIDGTLLPNDTGEILVPVKFLNRPDLPSFFKRGKGGKIEIFNGSGERVHGAIYPANQIPTQGRLFIFN